MSDIEDNARNLTWWWVQLDLSRDWNSMPRKMREELRDKFQQVFLALADFNITKQEITDLIIATDPPTVWEAMLALRGLPNLKKKNRWEILAYLNKVVTNIWKLQHPLEQPTWQPAPKPEKRKRPASLETIEKWDSRNFKKRHCDGCGKLLRGDNGTGLCRTCQRQRNGKDIEH